MNASTSTLYEAEAHTMNSKFALRIDDGDQTPSLPSIAVHLESSVNMVRQQADLRHRHGGSLSVV